MKRIIILLAIVSVIFACSRSDNQEMNEMLKGSLNLADLTTVYTDTLSSNRDQRFFHIRHTDMHYTMPDYPTLNDWQRRADELRTHIWVTTGLMPQPKRTPLNPHIFDRIEREDYTVEKVFFESYPNFYVTGNLYRPKGKTPPFPGIVSPHGHWQRGRIHSDDLGSIPGRCINFAKQGYVIFAYSMVGYNDSQQLDHGFGAEPAQNLWGINLMGLQLWNSIRAVDFLLSLPEVDSTRVGCTGASGGGTQTFMLTAVDDRIKVAAPVNMISAIMQGGCLCENAPLLRLNAYNVEIGALAAPRPLLMVSATGDWTKNTLKEEYPDTRKIYKLYQAEEKVKTVQIDAPHNYNKSSREAVYAWFGKWFLGEEDSTKFKEKPFTVEKDEDLLAFAPGYLPEGALEPDGLTQMLIENRKKELNAARPSDRESAGKLDKAFGTVLRHTLSATMPEPSDLIVESSSTLKVPGFTIEHLVIGRRDVKDKIPAILYMPKKTWRQKVGTVVVHPLGKAALVDSAQKTVGPIIQNLMKRNQAVLVIDCFNTGEHVLATGKTDRSQGYRHFTTFNPTDLALRVQDILTVIGYLDSRKDIRKVDLLGIDEAGLWCLLARSQAPKVDRTVVDAFQFDNQSDQSFLGEMYIPNLRRAGDFAVAGALIAPGRIMVHNTGEKFKTQFISAAYEAIGQVKNLVIKAEKVGKDELVNWLCSG